MPVATHACRTPAVNLIVFTGVVGVADLDALLAFYAADGGEAARRDEILLFAPGADLATLTGDDLIAFKERLAVIIGAATLPMIVRTALVCQEPACLPVLEAWAAMSASDDGLLTQTRVIDMAAAGEWLALTRVELDAFLAQLSLTSLAA